MKPVTISETSDKKYWIKRYEFKGMEAEANAVALMPNGDIVIAGSIESKGKDAKSSGLVARLDREGNVKWVRILGGGKGDRFNDVKVAPNGDIVIVGTTWSFVSGWKDIKSRIWVLRLDSSGNIKWQKTYGGSKDAKFERANAVALASNGDIIVAGYTESFSSDGKDVWILKLDSNGNVIWQKTYSGSGSDWAFTVAIAPNGDIIVAGWTNSFGVNGWNVWILKVLKKLRLIRNGKVTRALILLFGKDPQEFFPQAKVRVGRFKGSEILDSVNVEGNLFEQVEGAVNAIKKHMSRRYVIKGLVREEVWDYPLEAVREAVVNAVMHKDYRMPEEVQIKVLDDRIIFWNPGGLPVGLTEEDLYREHPSKPRNRLIAEVFHLAGYVEKWGSGTLRILRAFEDAKLPRPEFKEAFGGFQVVFYRDWLTEERLRELGLNERQVKAVLYVKEKGSITNREYREMFGVSKETAKRDLKELVDAGIFKKIGETGRSVRYILKGSNES
ncbi:ATP-binding protein [Thermococcus gammatolerans]|uniref:Transcription regulator, HTH/deoR family n=1 Tax=Thermococcus gammatolerans (strain DSM 15229 / JCM 11827 / EJ3) TaxID=593117 RepID=C5A5G5_THEGJ|nr:ATP-binding protein [Thermococcus gammatolerans]ACS33477.1 Transcription regulator, HTH/deoR family [Thermococcus gammatolerans EJ3]